MFPAPVKLKLKLVVIIEAIIIVLLVGILFYTYHTKSEQSGAPKQVLTNPNLPKLLSPRVYAGVLKPKSLLILNFDSLRNDLNTNVVKGNRNISIYIENLRDGASLSINDNETFTPASLNKLPIAIIIMKKVEDKELSMDTLLDLNKDDRMSNSGELYKTPETKLSVKVLVEQMLKESDNTAYKVLLHQASLEDIQYLSDYLDYYKKNITYEAEHQPGKQIDEITTSSMYNIFSSLYLSTVLEPEYANYILNTMTDTAFDIKKLANLPDNVIVSQKFGINYEGTEIFHSCGIMYINESRLFYCIMTKNLDKDEAAGIIGLVVNKLYHYVIDTRSTLDSYKETGKI